jgi:hypothetical protein
LLLAVVLADMQEAASEVQTSVAQSVFTRHFFPTTQELHAAPPQSSSVSAPLKMPSMHVCAVGWGVGALVGVAVGETLGAAVGSAVVGALVG